MKSLLSPLAPRLPSDWIDWVNETITRRELERLRLSVMRGQPYGDEAWVRQAAGELGLKHTLRREGRPRKDDPEN